MFKEVVGNGNENNMKTNDDQSSDREIGDKRSPDTIKNFASMKYAKKKTNIYRVEKYYMKHMFVCIEGIQMQGKKEKTGCQI